MAGGTIFNSTHYGIAGYWTTMAEKAGMIGISGTNARPSVAPTFGVEPMMGTNPLTFTMPTDEEFPFNFDCATSIIQNGKIEFYARQGKDTPAGLVVAKDGGTMTESATILKEMRAGNVALLPLGGLGEETGGYKGYGFTTIVEILSSALAGGPFMKALSGKDENATTLCIIWATSSSLSTRRSSWALTPSRKLPAISAAVCVIPPRLPVRNASILPARRNTWLGWIEKRRVYRLANPFRRSSFSSEMSWA